MDVITVRKPFWHWYQIKTLILKWKKLLGQLLKNALLLTKSSPSALLQQIQWQQLSHTNIRHFVFDSRACSSCFSVHFTWHRWQKYVVSFPCKAKKSVLLMTSNWTPSDATCIQGNRVTLYFQDLRNQWYNQTLHELYRGQSLQIKLKFTFTFTLVTSE